MSKDLACILVPEFRVHRLTGRNRDSGLEILERRLRACQKRLTLYLRRYWGGTTVHCGALQLWHLDFIIAIPIREKQQPTRFLGQTFGACKE